MTSRKPHPDAVDRPTIEQIQSRILNRICETQYKPGDQLKEAVIAQEFGVSRTPVRDALSRISHLGLVETRNGVGTVVIDLPRERIEHLYEVRFELATLIGKLSPVEIQDHHIAEAREIDAWARRLAKDENSTEYVALNQRLKTLVGELIGNSILRDLWNQSYYQAASVWHRMTEAVGAQAYEHLQRETSELLAAIELRDIAAVGYIQRVHIGYGYQLIRKHLWQDED